MWVFVSSFLVIALHVVVPDYRLMVLICMMACVLSPDQSSTAGTIYPNQSLSLT